MAAPGGAARSRMEAAGAAGPIPGHRDADSFVKYALGTVVTATKASSGIPQCGDDYDFYRSFPAFQEFCETQGDRLLQCMSKVMQYHGCRSNIKDRSKVTELEDKFDLLVDANDAILERVGNLLDEASGVVKNQQPILPAGLEAPKTIVSSWNRKGGESQKRTKSATFRLLHAKNILRPQLKFREKVDNTNTPFVPKLFIKPNAQKPLAKMLAKRRNQQKRPEDLDVPPALADFIHNQRLQNDEHDLFTHPYQYELDHWTPSESLLQKPQIQMHRPLEETPCHYVSTLEQLVQLNEKLLSCSEFALDLEHHSYRSFLGLTCLMQISTRTEDFIIDALELRSELYILNESFTDPAIVKVLHGADSDVEWLQKDFGLYLVNMFDTHPAARALNLGRHSLDHLLKLYCNVQSDKRYQLADWRIRPLPEEMLQYARADTHYLLYIYDKVRSDLLEGSNGQPNLLHAVWQKSKDLCLRRYVKPIYTEDSYLELYRKQKRHLNTQQLTAFRLIYSWRDRMARQEDESTGYVLPNHMLLKISEELPKEPQGIVACCNPIPPLVRQQINELHLLVQQAREMPLLKSEIQSSGKKKGPMPHPEKVESLLFGPHDGSRAPDEAQNFSSTEPAPLLKRGNLFSEDEDMSDPDEAAASRCLITRASITIFSDPEDGEDDVALSVAQQKARNIMESFENPFRMYLPQQENSAHISQAAKFDPSTKIFEISQRWKLVSQAQLQKEATAKEESRKRAQEQLLLMVARKQTEAKYQTAAEAVISVRQQATEENANKKRERVESEPGAQTPKPGRKRSKGSEQPPPDAEEQPPAREFTPFDYSKSEFKAFTSGNTSKKPAQFDPNNQNPTGKKSFGAKKHHPSAGNRSMSFVTGKSDRGFKHSWPKR